MTTIQPDGLYLISASMRWRISLQLMGTGHVQWHTRIVVQPGQWDRVRRQICHRLATVYGIFGRLLVERIVEQHQVFVGYEFAPVPQRTEYQILLHNKWKETTSISRVVMNIYKWWDTILLTFFLATCRSCSELNWNVSKMGTNAESHTVVKNVSEYSKSDGNCCSNCQTQSKNSSNSGLCSVVSLLMTWPKRSLYWKYMHLIIHVHWA